MSIFKSRERRRFAFRKVTKQDFTNARLIDDEFFKVCFAGNVEAAQILVDRILGVPGLKVVSATIQEHVSLLHSKTVVLDLLAKTESGEEVDIEVQRSKDPYQARRGRYYLSMMTARMLQESEPYQELRDAYVLFICEHDPFGKGRPIYSFAMREKTSPEADYLNDGACVCFFNCAYKGDDALGKLASDMLSKEWRSIDDPVLQSLVKQGKINAEDPNMSYRAEAEFDRGYIKGRSEGRNEVRKEDVISLIRNDVSPELIAKSFNMTIDEVLEIAKSIEA